MSIFGSQVKVYKFEDAIRHPYGLVGHFLASIGFPEDKIKSIYMIKSNESRSMEVIEFISELNRQEPYSTVTDSGRVINRNRQFYGYPESPFFLLTKPKFDFSFDEKKKFAELFQSNMQWLEEATGIHYDLSVAPSAPVKTYEPEVIEQFATIFPMLIKPLQKVFLDFFEKKHRQTGEEKFKQLFSPGSKPWKSFEYTKQTYKLLEAEPIRKGSRMFFDHADCGSSVISAFLNINYDGNGYLPINFVPIPPDKENRLVLKREFSSEDNVKQFLIHPSTFSCVAILKTLVINGKEKNYACSGNYDDHFGDTYAFFRDWPCLEFTCDEVITSIDLELIVDTGTYPFSFCVRKWGDAVDQELTQLRTQLESEQQELAQVRIQLAVSKTLKGSIKNFILVFLPPHSRRRAVIKKIYFALRGWPVE